MSLSYLNTENVKGLKNDHYSLKPVTYIHGDNRSGKTAILQAIQQAVFGRSDEIGAKGAGALIHRDHSSCSMECGGDMVVFRAGVAFGKKGVVSQTRSCTINGNEVTDAEVTRLVGTVPSTIAGFRELTGEQVWRLIMTLGGSDELPEGVVREVNSLCSKLQECGFDDRDIICHLSGDVDCFTRATSLLEAINSKQRLVREKARALLTAMEPPETPYSGPSVGNLKLEEKSLKEQLSKFQEALRQKSKAEETLKYNDEQVRRFQVAIEDSRKTIARMEERIAGLTQACFNCEQVLAALPDFIDPSSLSGTNILTKKVEDLIETIRSLNPEHEICTTSQKLVELVSQYITQNTYRPGDNPALDAVIEVANNSLGLDRVASITRKSFSSALVNAQNMQAALQREVANAVGADDARANTIKRLQDESESLRQTVDSAQNVSGIQEVSTRLAEVSGLITQAQEYATAVANAQNARSESNRLLSTVPYFSSVIDVLQAYRVKALKEGIDVVADKANVIIGYCDLPKVILEPVAGKRPSLLIRNEAGSQIAAMSGAEKLIYYSALILAIQSVHNVLSPLLFLEGGELDITFTQKFLLALAQHFKADAKGNVFLAHHLESRVIDLKVGVIHV